MHVHTNLTPTQRVVRIVRPYVPDAEKLVHCPVELAIRAVEKVLEQRLQPEVRAEIVREFKPYLGKRTVPMLVGNRLLEFLYTRCLSTLPIQEARRVVGYHFCLVYSDTLIMKAMAVAMRQVSIEWVLQGLPHNFAQTTNFGSYEMVEVAPRHWQFSLEDYPVVPEHTLGFLEAGSVLLENDAQYRYTRLGPNHCRFDITWEQGRVQASS